MKTKALLLTILLICCFAAALSAQTPTNEAPRKINFQGKLNNPTSGTVNLTFSIYKTATSPTVLWDETQNNVALLNGIFNVLLGNVKPIPNSVFKNGGDLFLGIKVGTNPELPKRVQISSVAYAIKATHADTAVVAMKLAGVSGGTGVFVDNNGNVGIGTTGPASLLDVRGTIRAGTFTNPPFGSGPSLEIGIDNELKALIQAYNRTAGSSLPLYFSGSDFRFSEAGSEVMRIDGGNVGIGTLPATDARLVIQTSSNGTAEGVLTRSPDGSFLFTMPNMGQGNYNGIVQKGDAGIIFSSVSKPDTGALVIAPWANRIGGIRINAQGNVGIGNSTPEHILDVNAKAGQAQEIARIGHTPGISNGLRIYKDAQEKYSYFFDFGAVGSGSSGSIGIGTLPDPSIALKVNGPACGTTQYTICSDLRYKKNIASIPNAMEKITRLRGVSFYWLQEEFPELNFTKGRNLGFIAQEIKDVLPEVVSQDSKGYYSVAYSNVVPVLVEAIKEQQQTIAQLQTQVTELAQTKAELQQSRTDLATFKEKLSRIESSLQRLERLAAREGNSNGRADEKMAGKEK